MERTWREDEFIARLMQIADPVERGLTAILSKRFDGNERGRRELLSRIKADLAYDSLGRWVAQRAELLGIPPDGYADIITEHKPRFGKPKEVVSGHVAYWNAGYSDSTHAGGSVHFPQYGLRKRVVLTANGRCLYVSEGRVRCRPSGASDDSLMWIGIIGLARRFGVEPLPEA